MILAAHLPGQGYATRHWSVSTESLNLINFRDCRQEAMLGKICDSIVLACDVIKKNSITSRFDENMFNRLWCLVTSHGDIHIQTVTGYEAPVLDYQLRPKSRKVTEGYVYRQL